MVMKFGLGAAGGNGLSIAAGAVGAVVLVAGGYMVFQAVNDPVVPPVAQPIAQVPDVPQVPDSPQVADSPLADPAIDVPEADTPPGNGTDASLPPATAPQFDLVRVEADGATIIAGQADPGVDVHIELDGKDVAVVQADATGNFVALMDVTLMDRPQVVTLSSVGAGGDRLVSGTSAIIDAVAVPATSEPVQVAEAGEPIAAPENVIAPIAEPEAAEQPNAEPNAEPNAATVAEVPMEQTQPTAAPESEPVVLADVPETPAPTTPAGSANDTGQSDVVDIAEAAPIAPEDQTPSSAPADDPALVAVAETPPAIAASPVAPAPDVLTELGSPAIEGPGASGETPPILAVTAATQSPVPPAPPRILLASPEGITIVQPGGQGPAVLDQVTLDAISYDAGGEVQLSGRGTGAANVQVYLNNRPVLTTRISEDGQWRTQLPEVESGVYTLRIDEVRDDGTVASRLETPFQREDAAQLAAVAASVATGPAEETTSADAPRVVAPIARAVTVQPGSTLWAIARERFGSGQLYVRVFEANRDQIRDPDLIYPGQVFVVPVE